LVSDNRSLMASCFKVSERLVTELPE
jgi:hypothetical protein